MPAKSRIVDVHLDKLIQSVNDDLLLKSTKVSVFLLKSARGMKDVWNTLGLFVEDLRNTLRLFTKLVVEFGCSPENEKPNDDGTR